MKITAYNKFIVALVGLVVSFGWVDVGLSDNLIMFLTASGVLLIPNQG